MAELEKLTEHLGVLLAQIEPDARKKLSVSIAKKIRTQNQQRIAKQLNPDGSPYTPRKKKLRDKKGRIKDKMFMRLKNAKQLRIQNEPGAIAIGFTGRIARIARVHQYGLRERLGRNKKQVKYPVRELLGFTGDEIGFIENEILNHIKVGL